MRTPDNSSGPELVIAATVATLGTLLALTSGFDDLDSTLVEIVVAFATAGVVAICRSRPGLALALVWVVALAHLVTNTQISLVELAFVVVSFATARWGGPVTVLLSGLSIPGFALLLLLLVGFLGYLPPVPSAAYDIFLQASNRFGAVAYIGAALLGVALLGVPWLAGVALRFRDSAVDSQAGRELAEREAAQAQHESEQAREIARLRDDQARLARDVHDVVGHSLAVILAQAESAQYLADNDTEKLKSTMANIATSARSSLQDVRHVLTTAAGDEEASVAPRPLDTLVEGVRASGHEVVSHELGTPQPLPPDLEVVVFRVLQEMLTNAVKHGSRDETLFVERHWPDGALAGELRIEVRNCVGGPQWTATDETRPVSALPRTTPSPPADGRGLDGMRQRLDACGGRLDVRRRDGERPGEPATFTATAWVPVRTVSP